MAATDGRIGKVRDVYFDDRAWAVRYLVTDMGNWLEDKRVLVSPRVLGRVDPENDGIETRLTRAQIDRSPPADSHKPVSDHLEVRNYPWLGWPPVYSPAEGPQRGEEVHLRSVEEVTGYSVEAIDGSIGHVADFLVDDAEWVIRYLVIDSWDWLLVKHVLFSPEWVRNVDWNTYTIRVDVRRDTIKNAPKYDPDFPVTREYEAELCSYYGKQGYWVRERGVC